MAENFRHADMSPEEFVEDLERRGDSIWKMVARMMGAGIASSSTTGGDAGMLLPEHPEHPGAIHILTSAQQLKSAI